MPADPDLSSVLAEWEAAGFPWRSADLPKIPPPTEILAPVEAPTPGWGWWPAAAGVLLGLAVAALYVAAFTAH